MTALTPARRPVGAAHRVDVDGGVKSVSSALDVLECFDRDEELSLSAVARRLGLAKSTTHRHVTTLCARGLLEKSEESSRYRLGLHLFELGQRAQDRSALHRAAMPLLEELRQASGLTVHLTIPDGADCLFLERLQTLNGISLLVDSDRRQPSHCTSSGKAIAAFNPAFAQARCRAGFAPLTQRSISTEAQYRAVLDEVRRLGFATADGEARVGLASVAAPVRNWTGTAVASISVAGPSNWLAGSRGSSERLVLAAARKLQRAAAH